MLLLSLFGCIHFAKQRLLCSANYKSKHFNKTSDVDWFVTKSSLNNTNFFKEFFSALKYMFN